MEGIICLIPTYHLGAKVVGRGNEVDDKEQVRAAEAHLACNVHVKQNTCSSRPQGSNYLGLIGVLEQHTNTTQTPHKDLK